MKTATSFSAREAACAQGSSPQRAVPPLILWSDALRALSMIAYAAVLLVEDMLAAGVSQRATARLTGISRGRVHLIAHGRQRHQRAPKQEPLPLDYGSPPKRCPGCGGKVYMPCLLCRTRKQTSAKPSRGNGDAGELTLDLRPHHQQRYEQVRRKKETEGEIPD